MIKQIIRFFKNYNIQIVEFLFGLLLLSILITKSGIINISLAAVVKIVIGFFLFLYTIFFLKKTFFFKSVIILIIVFLTGQYFLDVPLSITQYFNNLKSNPYSVFFIKYMYTILFIGFFYSIKERFVLSEKLLKYFNFFLAFNFFLILIGFIFSLELFRTYPGSSRFGYQGLVSINTCLIGVVFNYIYTVKNNKPLFFYIACLSSLFYGKKIVLLVLVLLIICELWRRKKNYILWIIALISLLSFVFLNTIIEFLVLKNKFWMPLYKSSGIITVLTSTRDLSLKDMYVFIQENWSYVNVFTGGINQKVVYTEFGLFDLYFMFGFFGVGIYTIIFKKYIFGKNRLCNLLIIILLIVELLSGSMLNNIFSMLLIYILAVYMNTDITANNKRKMNLSL